MILSVRLLALFALSCCIADAAPISKLPGDAPADATERADSPDLIQMLNALHGETSLQKLSKFIKEFKGAREIMKGFMSMNLLGRQILESASKRNIKLKVLLDVVNGHFPDLHDIYKFATDHNDSIVKALMEAEKTDPNYELMYSLITNKTDFQKQILLTTGKKIVLKPSLINEVKTGQYKLSPENVNQVNLLEMWFFLDDNWNTMMNATAIGENLNYVKILQQLKTMDVSHLARIVSPRSGLSSPKYTVTSRNQDMVQDPDVTMMLKDFKAAGLLSDNAKNQSKAEALLLDMYMRLARVYNKVLEKASTGTSSNGLSRADTNTAANMG